MSETVPAEDGLVREPVSARKPGLDRHNRKVLHSVKPIPDYPIRYGMGKKYAFFRSGRGMTGKLSVWGMPAAAGEVLALGPIGRLEFYLVVTELGGYGSEFRFFVEKLSRTRFRHITNPTRGD